MRAIKTQKGLTIVETLIVLAVTGVMLIAMTVLVGGQISRYQFRESSFNMEQKLIDVVNDVGVGYFDIIEGGTQSISPLPPGKCKEQGGANQTSDPGKSDCVYVGKKVEIKPAPNSTMTVSSLVADATVSSLEGEDVAAGPANVIIKDDLTEVTTSLPSGLDYTKGTTFYILFDRFGATTEAGNVGEGQSVSVYGVEAGKFKKIPDGVNSLSVCASNGSRVVTFRVGVNGSSSVEVDYNNRTDWGCP